ncbi:MAG: hypothetical protein J7M40_13295 [Planctomycetes bacterium]|nr:hypothetical protein [Planctomycetota bacterium]
MTNYDPFGFAQDRFSICYFGAARDNYEVRNENYGFCSIYGEACDATGVVLGKDVKKVAAPYIHPLKFTRNSTLKRGKRRIWLQFGLFLLDAWWGMALYGQQM